MQFPQIQFLTQHMNKNIIYFKIVKDGGKAVQDILLITNTDSSEGFIKELLMNASYGKIWTAYNYSDGTNLLDVHPFDLVIINAPMRDELGDRLAKYAAQRTHTSIFFIARETMFAMNHDILTKFGILCIKKPVAVKPFQQLIKVVETTCAQVAKMDKENKDNRERIDELRLIDAAKWHLISQFNISESQATRTFEQFAIDRKVSRLTAADLVLLGGISAL